MLDFQAPCPECGGVANWTQRGETSPSSPTCLRCGPNPELVEPDPEPAKHRRTYNDLIAQAKARAAQMSGIIGRGQT